MKRLLAFLYPERNEDGSFAPTDMPLTLLFVALVLAVCVVLTLAGR